MPGSSLHGEIDVSDMVFINLLYKPILNCSETKFCKTYLLYNHVTYKDACTEGKKNACKLSHVHYTQIWTNIMLISSCSLGKPD